MMFRFAKSLFLLPILLSLLVLSKSVSAASASPSADGIPEWTSYRDKKRRFEIQYPSSFRLAPLEKGTQLLFKAVNDRPSALFTIRYEGGLSKLQAVGGGSILEKLLLSVNKQFPARYPGYKKEKYQELVLANEKAAVIVFSYIGNDKKTRVKEIFSIISRGLDAFYLSAQTPEKEFSTMSEVFNRMIRSFNLTP